MTPSSDDVIQYRPRRSGHQRYVRKAGAWLLPGLVGGALFLGVAMIGGSLTTTPWAMPRAIAAVVGLGVHGYSFQLFPVLVGVTVHLIISMGLGVLYTAIARLLRLHRWRLVLAIVIFDGLETAITIWVILHTVLPLATFRFFLRSVPFWASFVGRNVYALCIGFMLVRSEARSDRAAAPGNAGPVCSQRVPGPP
jgi:hypothetical protein